MTGHPRRTIALGPPYDDGKVPKKPAVLTDDERLDRIERRLERLNDSLEVLISLRRDRGETVEDIINQTAARIGPDFDGHFPGEPSLDTREAIIEILHRYECDEEPLPHDWREHLPYDEPEVHPNRIDALADLFARLDEGSATPDTLPPCPICGKDDLFVGRDGKPGCPHCEVAVRLPDEGSATPDQGKG